MFEIETRPATMEKAALYAALAGDLRALLDHEHDLIANAANMASLIYHTLPDVNWAGFYFLREGEGELVLGPFHGKPACVRIAMGKGVCGTAAQRRVSVVVPDVDAFPGHIACDSASRAELVVPLIQRSPLQQSAIQESPIHAAGIQESPILGSDIHGSGAHESRLLGVLDLDSPTPARFDDIDREGCETLVRIFIDSLAPATRL